MQKILIVEDDQDIAELERDYLEANGYGVEIASDGKEGIRKALEADVDKIRGLGLGADDYIVKPFSPGELVARVKAHLHRYQQLTGQHTGNQLLQRGDLSIDREGHRVYLKGKEVPMPNKEFSLLLFLAENPGVVFSKETLFERIWGEDSLGDTATVSVHVNRIREKIESSTTKPEYIETVWGVGYRFRK